MSDDKHPPPEENPEDDTAAEILADGVAGLLNKPEIAKGISEYLNATAKNKSAEPGFATWSLILNLAFSGLIFAGIVILGWYKVISGEATTGLLGALIGYWYGRERGSHGKA